MDEKESSVEEMKTAADDIKKLRPVQEAVIVALNLRSWKDILDALKSEETRESTLLSYDRLTT